MHASRADLTYVLFHDHSTVSHVCMFDTVKQISRRKQPHSAVWKLRRLYSFGNTVSDPVPLCVRVHIFRQCQLKSATHNYPIPTPPSGWISRCPAVPSMYCTYSPTDKIRTYIVWTTASDCILQQYKHCSMPTTGLVCVRTNQLWI